MKINKKLLFILNVSSVLCAGDYTNRFSVFVDGLYWQAQEDGLDYAIQNNNGAVRINSNGIVRRMEFDKRGGFRVGAAYRTPCNDYVLNAFWTRYHTTGKTCLSVVYPVTLFPVWTNPTSLLTSEQNATTCAKLHLDMFDLRATVLFDAHKRVDVMASAGAVYARINQAFSINTSGGQSNGPVATVLNDAIRMNNNFQGAGPKIGVNTVWDAAKRFALVMRADAALLYGKFNLYQNETVTFSNDIDQTTFLNLPCNNFHRVRPIVDLMLGVRWDRERHQPQDSCCSRRCTFSAEIGWELNYLFGQNMLMRFTDDINPGVNIEINGDLGIQGLTVRFNIGF